MSSSIRLISTDFDGTLVDHAREPVLDADCLALIAELQDAGALWAINTGRSLELTQSGLLDFDFPIQPDFILTSERDIFQPSPNGGPRWIPFGDWNDRCAAAHRKMFGETQSLVRDVLAFVAGKTRARVLYLGPHPEGVIAESEEELNRIVAFLDEARAKHPQFHYQRNTIYLRFCHADYHKGAALAELGRLTNIGRENIFAAGDNHNDLTMLDGKFAAMAACPANAISLVKETVRAAEGYVSRQSYGAGVHEALRYFSEGAAPSFKRSSLSSRSRKAGQSELLSIPRKERR